MTENAPWGELPLSIEIETPIVTAIPATTLETSELTSENPL